MLKVAYNIGVLTAQRDFYVKTGGVLSDLAARGGNVLLSAIPGAALGAGAGGITGAVASDSGNRLQGALQGAGLGALLGGAGSLAGAYGGAGAGRGLKRLQQGSKDVRAANYEKLIRARGVKGEAMPFAQRDQLNTERRDLIGGGSGLLAGGVGGGVVGGLSGAEHEDTAMERLKALLSQQ